MGAVPAALVGKGRPKAALQHWPKALLCTPKHHATVQKYNSTNVLLQKLCVNVSNGVDAQMRHRDYFTTLP